MQLAIHSLFHIFKKIIMVFKPGLLRGSASTRRNTKEKRNDFFPFKIPLFACLCLRLVKTSLFNKQWCYENFD